MKIFITFLMLILNTCSLLHAQNVYEHLSADSMNNSPNPGNYFVNYLTSQANNLDSTAINESDDRHKSARLMSFWQDRIPIGSDLTQPFLKYQQALKNAAGSSCTLPEGSFKGNWENIGPKILDAQMQGLVYDIWVDPTNANIIFVGVQDGGLWKTINNGASWTCISDQFQNVGTMGIEALTINPYNHDEIFVGTNGKS